MTPEEIRAHFAKIDKSNREALARAEKEAELSGKEPFERSRFDALLTVGPVTGPGNDALLMEYYVSHPEIRTIAEFARYADSMVAWGVW